MAKTLAKIARPSIKGLREELREYRDGYAQSQKDLAAMAARNAENSEWKNEARANAAEWKAHAEKLDKVRNELGNRVDRLETKNKELQGQLNRCIGYIAAHHAEHPAPEATPAGREETRDMGSYMRPVPKWRSDLGL